MRCWTYELPIWVSFLWRLDLDLPFFLASCFAALMLRPLGLRVVALGLFEGPPSFCLRVRLMGLLTGQPLLHASCVCRCWVVCGFSAAIWLHVCCRVVGVLLAIWVCVRSWLSVLRQRELRPLLSSPPWCSPLTLLFETLKINGIAHQLCLYCCSSKAVGLLVVDVNSSQAFSS